MLTLVIRCLIIYIIVLFICRIMGKRQMGELQPFEFVITLIIADLATIPMAEINVPLVHGVIPLFTLAILHYLISFLCRKSIIARTVVNGKPIIVISPRGIDYVALKTLNMNIDDLVEALRELNYFSFEDVLYAIVETNGQLTVYPKFESQPITPKTVTDPKSGSDTPPMVLISDGVLCSKTLSACNLTKKWYEGVLKKENLSEKEIFLMTCDPSAKYYIVKKEI